MAGFGDRPGRCQIQIVERLAFAESMRAVRPLGMEGLVRDAQISSCAYYAKECCGRYHGWEAGDRPDMPSVSFGRVKVRVIGKPET